MIDNTTNPNCPQYKVQGALGVRVDKAFWDYMRFEEYVLKHLGPPVEPRICLVRIKKLKNWGPGNIKWVTTKENSFMRRYNAIYTYKGQKKPLKQWCDELGLNYSKTFSRIYDYGWTVKDAFEL